MTHPRLRFMARAPAAIAKGLATTLIFFLLAEIALRGIYDARNAFVERVPLPFALGDEYGPIPPWLDRLLILVPDDALIWHALPNVRRTYVDIFSPARSARDRTALLRRFAPWLPPEFKDNATWSIALNREGFRGPEAKPARNDDRTRIACIGDSWTFGMNAGENETYPSRLAARLTAMRPDRHYEVLNFGVLGYSSFQGRQLLARRVLDLRPDVVTIGFGMNDSEVAGYRDKDMVSAVPGQRPPWRERLKSAVTDLESYKLLDYLALVLKFRAKPVGDYLHEAAGDAGDGAVDYSTIEPWTRVSPRDFELNMREMIRLVSAGGARVVLLDNELWNESPYRPVLRRVSADLHVPLVDTLALLERARMGVEHDVAERLGLHDGDIADSGLSPTPKVDSAVNVVFRVSRGAYPVTTAMSIVGPSSALGSDAPNTIVMRDDGTGGDEHAGDGVWSYTVSVPAGSRLVYVYTNSGRRGEWEGLDVPFIRHVTVPSSTSGQPVYLPVETFGKVYLQTDNWHTDAAGYDLMAEAVARAIGAGSASPVALNSSANPRGAAR